MLSGKVIVVAFNAQLADGCDYATQTLRLLGRTNTVYGLLLGEPITWKDVLRNRAIPLTSQKYNSTLIRPFFVFPGQRIFIVKQVNYLLNAIVFRLILSLRHPKQAKVLWFFEPWNMVPIFLALRGYFSLYDCVDYYAPLAYEPFSHEQYLIQHASVMTCTSEALANEHRIHRDDIHVVPLGFAKDAIPVGEQKRRHKK